VSHTGRVIPFSILDLSPVRAGATVGDALRTTVALAQHAERLGYQRFWMAEHHGMPAIASSATSVLVGQVAAHTRTIRVGSGGVMLPNHAPLVVAEHYGTLEALFPGRIDLGLGRAPGTDGATAQALGHDLRVAMNFEQVVTELRGYLADPQPGSRVRAIPGEGSHVPVWILGSSTDSARVAAALGLPYAFASHFAPAQLLDALALYRETFRPSEALAAPYAMVGLNAVLADDDAEAARLFTSVQQQFRDVRRGRLGPLQPPVEDPAEAFDRRELAELGALLAGSVVGSPETARGRIVELQRVTGADEFLFTAQIFAPEAALHSYRLLAEVRDALGAGEGAGTRDAAAAG
jgi:luciferase family oxidoreductase group 1